MAGPSEKKIQPIVIKRIKKVSGGHHGGAWKIAYADFVTAMMAFFLLMWLLGSTSTGDLKGISDYFQTPLKVSLSGGRGSGETTSIINGGGEDLSRSAGQVMRGEMRARDPASANEARIRRENAQLAELKTAVEESMVKLPEWKDLKDQVRLEVTTDGLSIEIIDANNKPMFASGSTVVQPAMRSVLRTIGGLLNQVDSSVSMTGHTDASPYSGNYRGYSNWELSSDRANASRRELVAGGLQPEKIVRVVGLGAVVPLDKSKPLDPMNRRIAIVVLNSLARERILGNREVHASGADQFRQAAGFQAAGSGAAAAPVATPAAGRSPVAE